MVDVMAAERTFAQLKRTEVGLDLDYEGEIYPISSDDVSCSTVLSEVLQTIAEGDLVPLPVDGEVVQLWLAYVHNPAGDGHTRSVEVLVATVQAADLLGDIAATAHLASELAERLFPKPDEDDRLLENFMFDGSDDVWDAENFPFKEGTIRAATERRAAYSKQVLDQLSNDLVISIMRAVPELSTLFRSLPPSLHATALRARHPSIDAAHTLTTTLPDGITAAHTARAAAALPHLTSLSLTVRGYRFTSRLASFQRVLRALGDVPCAVALSVAEALPTGVDLPALVLRQHLPNLRHMTRLAISPTSLFPGLSAIGPHLSGLSNLHTLDVSTPGSYPDKGAGDLASALGALRALRDLSLSGVALEDPGWAAVARELRSTPLTALRLSRCGLSKGFVLLHTDGETAAGCTVPADVSTGGHTPVAGCDRAAGAGERSACMGHVELGQGGGDTGGLACRGCAGCAQPMRATLVVLDLSGNHLLPPPSGACFEQLRSLSGLQTLALGKANSRDEESDVLFVAGSGAKFSLRALDVSLVHHASLTPTLCDALRTHTGLTALSLEGSGATAGIAEGLRGLGRLRELRLGNCEALWQSGVAGGGWKSVARALGALTALRLLGVNACGLNPRRAVVLTQELSGLKELRALDLSRNAIREQGAMAVVAWVHTLPLLRVLRMHWTDVSTGVQQSISGQLGTHVSLSW